MAFSSVHEMIDLCKESGKPLYEVILESDLAESGLTRAESEAEMHRLWAVMQATSDGYCGADRSMSGFAGGDAAKVNAAAARGVLYADGYFADVMAEALKTAECNACMKRIVAAPTAGSCGVLPAVLLPLRRRGLADEAAVHRALYIACLLYTSLIRHFNAPRISDYLRITIGTPEQMQRFFAALDEILGE